MTPPTQPPVWSQDTKRVVVVIMLAMLVLLLYLSRSFLSLVVLAAVLAYIMQPLVGWLQRRGLARGLAAGLAVLVLVLVVALFPIILVPLLYEQAREIAVALSGFPDVVRDGLDRLLTERPTLDLLGIQVDAATSVEQLWEDLTQATDDIQAPNLEELLVYALEGARAAGGLLGTAATIATDVAAAVATVTLSAVLLLMSTFYLTRDGQQLRPWLERLVPPAYQPEIDQLLRRLNLTWQAFFRGQLLLSLTVGIVTTIVTALLGLPGALVLGILAGLLEVVPNLGPVLAAIPAVILALAQGSSHLPVQNWVFALIVIGAYVLIQQLENNLLVPRIMGQSLNLHPLLVLLGVFAGALAAGIVGAFLAAPVLASLKLMGMYVHAKLTDQPPFPEPPQVSEPDLVEAAEAGVKPLKQRLQELLPGQQATSPQPGSEADGSPADRDGDLPPSLSA